MQKIVQIIILSSILISCQSDKILNGTWISAYQSNPNDSLKKPNNGRPFNEVITFDNGIYKIKSYSIATAKKSNKIWMNFTHFLGNRKSQDEFIIYLNWYKR